LFDGYLELASRSVSTRSSSVTFGPYHDG